MPNETSDNKKRSSPTKFIREHFVWLLSGVALLVGVIIILTSLSMHGPPFLGTASKAVAEGGIILGGVNAEQVHDYSIWREILRDIGIAFLVAAVVTVIFELHARSRSDLETITGVLNMTMGDVVRPDIWREVKAQVIQSRMVREKMEVRIISVEPVGGPFGPAILTMDTEYDLQGLHYKKEADVTVAHDLDEHVPGNDMTAFPQLAGLPWFDYIKVGDDVVVETPPDSTPPASEHVNGGHFTYPLELPPRDKGSVHVTVRRKEIFYVPGSYNLAMGEITNGVVLYLDESLSEDIEVSVNLRPHEEGVLLPKGWPPLKRFERCMLLPGQVIEFRFRRIPKPVAAGAVTPTGDTPLVTETDKEEKASADADESREETAESDAEKAQAVSDDDHKAGTS